MALDTFKETTSYLFFFPPKAFCEHMKQEHAHLFTYTYIIKPEITYVHNILYIL